MAASISIVSGVDAGKFFWIESPVLRIGSGEHCQLRLSSPGLPTCAATLEYRNGAYHVYNRGQEPILANDIPLEPNGVAVWKSGKTINLADNISLRLIVEGDPAPVPHLEATLEDQDEDTADYRREAELPEGDGDAPPSREVNIANVIMMAVTGLCIVAMIGIALSGDSGSPATESPSFEEIVQAAGKSHHDLLEELRHAHKCILKNDKALAWPILCELRDELLYRRNTRNSGLSEVEEDMLRYVIDHLQTQSK